MCNKQINYYRKNIFSFEIGAFEFYSLVIFKWTALLIIVLVLIYLIILGTSY